MLYVLYYNNTSLVWDEIEHSTPISYWDDLDNDVNTSILIVPGLLTYADFEP